MNTKEFWENVNDYNKEIVSVFVKENLITKNIKEIKNKNKKIIADFGCGNGNSFKFITEFKEIYAIDYSSSLLNQANTAAKKLNLKNVNFINQDIKNNILLPKKCDIILAISSIFPDNLMEFFNQIQILKNNVKKGSELHLTFSSLESRTFYYILKADKMFKDNKKPLEIFQEIKNDEHTHNFSSFGYIKTTNGPIQKHWIKEELEMRLKEFKFHSIDIKKLELDWLTQTKAKDFKEYPSLWLWYVKIIL